MLRGGLTSILFLLGTGFGFSQQPAASDAAPKCSFSEVYKKDGWIVPGAKGAKTKQRAKLENTPGVIVTILEPAETETYIPEIWCSQDHPGRLEIENAPIEILSLWSFDFGGRVFAYRITYGEEAIFNGRRSHLAATATVFFYDMDGSGNFTIIKAPEMRGGGHWLPYLPDWVKVSANAPSAK